MPGLSYQDFVYQFNGMLTIHHNGPMLLQNKPIFFQTLVFLGFSVKLRIISVDRVIGGFNDLTLSASLPSY